MNIPALMADGVKVKHPDGDFELMQEAGFAQNKNLKAIFWEGCSVHQDEDVVKTHRKLFGATAVSIGWISLTGWEISDIVLGGMGNGTDPQPSNFFSRLDGSSDAVKIVPAWLLPRTLSSGARTRLVAPIDPVLAPSTRPARNMS